MKTAIALCASAVLVGGCSDDASPTPAEMGTGSSGGGTSTGSGATTISGGTVTSSGSTDTGTASMGTTGLSTTGLTSETTDASTGTIADTSTGGGFFPDGLECTSISLCSTYDADPSAPPFPKAPGGTLEDGIYRAQQGSSEPFGLVIAGDRYALIFEGLTASYGDLSVSGVTMTQTQTAACSSNGVVEIEPQSFDFAFWTDGDELFTYSGCDSLNPDVCGSGTRYVRVESLCDDLESLSCEAGGCECHAFIDEIPEQPGGCNF